MDVEKMIVVRINGFNARLSIANGRGAKLCHINMPLQCHSGSPFTSCLRWRV